MRQSPRLFKLHAATCCFPVILNAPRCWQQFGEILYSAKAELVPFIARLEFAFWSCLGFILIFECPGELDIIICGWRSTVSFFFFFFLALIPATVPSSVINGLWWVVNLWWGSREKESELGSSHWHPSNSSYLESDWDYVKMMNE